MRSPLSPARAAKASASGCQTKLLRPPAKERSLSLPTQTRERSLRSASLDVESGGAALQRAAPAARAAQVGFLPLQPSPRLSFGRGNSCRLHMLLPLTRVDVAASALRRGTVAS